MKVDEKQDIYIISKYLPTKYLLQRGKIIAAVEKSDRPGLNQTIKGHMTSTGDRFVLGVSWYELKKIYSYLCQKMHNLNPVISKHQINPNWRTFYKINGLYSSKISRSWETKVEELFWIKGNSETCLHNGTSESGWGVSGTVGL